LQLNRSIQYSDKSNSNTTQQSVALLLVNCQYQRRVLLQAGFYVMTLFDWYSGGLNVIVVALFEVCGVSWIYGIIS